MDSRNPSSAMVKKDVQCSICYEMIPGNNFKQLMLCPFCSRAFHFSCIEEQLVCATCDERVLWPPTGSEEYLDLLECLSPTFPTGDTLFIELIGEALTTDFFDRNGFNVPIKVKDKTGLGLEVPPSDFSIDDVIRYCGPELKIDVINVRKQEDVQMTLEEFGDYFKNKDELSSNDIYNLISLEFSDTQLVHIVKPPQIVKELSWVSTTSHDEIKEQLMENIDLSQTEFYPFGQPQVLRYCLISARNSFTDFHIDFGGTSVWYHLLWGRKVFYMVEPTDKNLDAFEKWMRLDRKDRTHSCFVENVDVCYRCEFSQGETIFMPAGWIHGVYTPEDSLVFGGNFLHYYGVPTSLKIYEMEKRLNIADRFTFPDYELVNFIAARNLCEIISSWKGSGKNPAFIHHIKAIKELVPRLKSWYESNSRLRHDLKETDDPINYKKLMKTLQKVVRRSNSGKVVKSDFSLSNNCLSDGDSVFHCHIRKKKGSVKIKHSSPEIKEEIKETNNKLIESQNAQPHTSLVSLSLPKEGNSDSIKNEESTAEDSEDGVVSEMNLEIDLKLKAKLIHTLPVQKEKKVVTAAKRGRKRKVAVNNVECGKKDEASTAMDRKQTSKDGEVVKERVDELSDVCKKLKEEATSSGAEESISSISLTETTPTLSPLSSSPHKKDQSSIHKKCRKGAATPKQRLGKILNIKMR